MTQYAMEKGTSTGIAQCHLHLDVYNTNAATTNPCISMSASRDRSMFLGSRQRNHNNSSMFV